MPGLLNALCSRNANRLEANLQLQLDDLYALLKCSASNDIHPAVLKRYRAQILSISTRLLLIPSQLVLDGHFFQNQNAMYIGSGGSASVFYQRQGSSEIAVKAFLPSQDAQKMCFKEAVIMALLQHRNILPLLGVIGAPNSFALATPYMRNGNLMTFLLRNPGANRLELVSFFLNNPGAMNDYPTAKALGIANGLSYLKSCGVCHGDIKAVSYYVGFSFRGDTNDG
ncbi:hypothetical protein H0H87_000492 [Tephrocybe sp. NHM501043]|nr:hypothetical protein H0H87_000492 [Tephrocybe sp. NHM501043]